MWETLEVASLGGGITQTHGACLVVMVLFCVPYFIYVLMSLVWIMAAHRHIIVRWWLIGMWWYDMTIQLISSFMFSNEEVCCWLVASDLLWEVGDLSPHVIWGGGRVDLGSQFDDRLLEWGAHGQGFVVQGWHWGDDMWVWRQDVTTFPLLIHSCSCVRLPSFFYLALLWLAALNVVANALWFVVVVSP